MFELDRERLDLQARARAFAGETAAPRGRRNGPERSVSVGHGGRAPRRRLHGHDHPGRPRRPGARLSRRGARHRADGTGVRGYRAHRGGSEHGRHRRRHALRLRAAEAPGCGAGPRWRQASHLHYRAGGGERGHRDGDASRSPGRRVRPQRPQALDYGGRGVQAPPHLRTGVRGRRGARHRRISRGTGRIARARHRRP